MKPIVFTKEKLTESLATQMDAIETGMRFVDSHISILDVRWLDMLAIDSQSRIALLNIKDKPQSLRSNSGRHVLKESVFLWHWVVDNKKDYFNGIKDIIGTDPSFIPPRLMIIAPEFTNTAIALANYVSEQIDIELYRYNPNNLKEKNNAYILHKDFFEKLNLKNYKPNKKIITSLNNYIDVELRTLRKTFLEPLKATGESVYKPYVVKT